MDRYVKIMADHAFPIWDRDGYLLEEWPPISEKLKADLIKWWTNYDVNCWDHYPVDHEYYKPFNTKKHSKNGLKLARRLKKECPDWTVIYFDEAKFDWKNLNQLRDEFEYEIEEQVK